MSIFIKLLYKIQKVSEYVIYQQIVKQYLKQWENALRRKTPVLGNVLEMLYRKQMPFSF